jgi:hypothetical protein
MVLPVQLITVIIIHLVEVEEVVFMAEVVAVQTVSQVLRTVEVEVEVDPHLHLLVEDVRKVPTTAPDI